MSAAPLLERSAAQSSEEVRPEELELYANERLVELVDGRVKEKTVSALSHRIANVLNRPLSNWAVADDRGETFVESTFQCFEHKPKQVRRPDVAYVPAARLLDYDFAGAHLTVVPDLVVEVVSPSDNVYDLAERLDDFRRAGTRRAWVIDPVRRTLLVRRGPGDVSELVGDAEIADPEVLPGFSARLDDLFPAGPAGRV